ncbi:MAG: type II toxin-antitoxin system VapC family toxin [Firmicutes bacterium]|nr:type II toxin-antitoxin system VapC family toxin [Bacillota bacterium]
MKILLDTHTFLWFLAGASELSKPARAHIENPETEKYISIASFWEISIKNSLGKLSLDVPFVELIRLIQQLPPANAINKAAKIKKGIVHQ